MGQSLRTFHDSSCFCLTVEGAAEVIGSAGGLQDLLAAMRTFPENPELCTTCCNALWSLTVNGTYQTSETVKTSLLEPEDPAIHYQLPYFS